VSQPDIDAVFENGYLLQMGIGRETEMGREIYIKEGIEIKR
jgi:hypothetical protein